MAGKLTKAGDPRPKSGPKAKPEPPAPLPPRDPPSRLTSDAERAAYSWVWDLASQAPKFSVCETELLILVARQIVRADRLAKIIADLGDSVMEHAGENGAEYLHPAYKALLSLEGAIQSSLSQLLCTSRSRSSARVAHGEKPSGGTTPGGGKPARQTAAEKRRFKVLKMMEPRGAKAQTG